MLIEFKRNGKAKQMNPKLARVLEKKGHVRIVDVGVETVAQSVPVIEKAAPVKEPENEVDLDVMSIEDLRTLAEVLGVTVHHRAGADKIRADIRAKM